MFIHEIHRNLAVCAFPDLARFAKSDPGFWNVISILEPNFPKMSMSGFLKVHHVRIYDAIGKIEESSLGEPRSEHMRAIFHFADGVFGEPILVHCRAGISRSAAVALALIVRDLHRDGFVEDEILALAPELLIQIRPQAAPNPLMLELGFSEFLSAEKSREWMRRIVSHPTFFANRFKGAEAQ